MGGDEMGGDEMGGGMGRIKCKRHNPSAARAYQSSRVESNQIKSHARCATSHHRIAKKMRQLIRSPNVVSPLISTHLMGSPLISTHLVGSPLI